MTKNHTVRFILQALAIAVLSMAVLLPAASAQSQVMKAYVPFEFYANAQRLPAGIYEVYSMPGQSVIRLANHQGNSIYMHTTPVKTGLEPQGRFVFNRYGAPMYFSRNSIGQAAKPDWNSTSQDSNASFALP